MTKICINFVKPKKILLNNLKNTRLDHTIPILNMQYYNIYILPTE